MLLYIYVYIPQASSPRSNFTRSIVLLVMLVSLATRELGHAPPERPYCPPVYSEIIGIKSLICCVTWGRSSQGVRGPAPRNRRDAERGKPELEKVAYITFHRGGGMTGTQQHNLNRPAGYSFS